MRDTALSPQDSEKVTVRFGVDVPNFTTSRAEGIDENKIETLELWVFDKDGHFLERAKAENVKASDNTNKIYTYEAKMTPAPDGCIIHFVANKSLGDDTKVLTLTGKNESDVLFSIDGTSTNNLMTMWGRQVYGEVKKDMNLGEVQVLRNMAKFGLVVTTDKLTDVTYALYRTYDKGSIAPFDPTDLKDPFKLPSDNVVTTPTEPAGIKLINSDKWIEPKEGSYHYGYERKNADAKEISCLIVKGTYQNEVCYYKIDFVNTDKVRYDILRNHFYKVTINDVRAKGYKSPEDALKGLAANNLALSEEIQSFPTFSDGAGTLVVKGDKTFFAVVDGKRELTFHVDFYPNNNTYTTDNSKLTFKWTNSESGSISGEPTNDNGDIKVPLKEKPANGGSLTSELIIGVNDNPELKRLVRIQVRPQFDLTVTPEYTTINKTQDTPLTLTLKIAEEFRKELLPITFRFYTENFYPSGNQGFSYGRKGDKTFYEVIVTSISDNRQFTYYFKSNKSTSAEMMKIECVEGYFKEKNVQITNSNW